MTHRFHLVDLDDPRFRTAFDPLIERWNARVRAPHHALLEVELADGMQTLVAGVAQRAHLEAGPERLIIPWAGVPRSVAAMLTEFPAVAVHNLHYNAVPVAEHALGLLLAVARRLIPADRGLRQGDWSIRFAPSDAPLLAGQRALILGAGALGQRISRVALGLDIQPTLLGTRARTVELAIAHTTVAVSVLAPNLLDQALAEADILIVTLPLTPATDDLIDARRLALLPEGALVINVGRGPVVNEAALFEALQSKRLAGAGLDVWYSYPQKDARQSTPPSSFDFGGLDNVVLSPHRAGHGLESERLCAELLFEALVRVATGQPVGSDVDPARGY